MAMKQRKRYIKGKTNPQAHDFIGSNKSRKDSKNQMEAIKKKKKRTRTPFVYRETDRKKPGFTFLAFGFKENQKPNSNHPLKTSKKNASIEISLSFLPLPSVAQQPNSSSKCKHQPD